MDYRCPSCRADLGKRKLIDAVVTQMEIDCTHCSRRIRLNIHRVETVVALTGFGSVLALGALAYWLKSDAFILATFAAAMLGSAALPLLERTWLRHWPRYVPATTRDDD